MVVARVCKNQWNTLGNPASKDLRVLGFILGPPFYENSEKQDDGGGGSED